MKKFIVFCLALLAITLLTSNVAQAQGRIGAEAGMCDESGNGIPPGTTGYESAGQINFSKGLVPCGRLCIDRDGNPVDCGTRACTNPADPAGTTTTYPCYQLICRCELYHGFIVILNIYHFIVFYIATPLMGLWIVVGGTLILLSGINPAWYDMGRNMVKWSILAVLLIFVSWIIIDVTLKIIGYNANWFQLPI